MKLKSPLFFVCFSFFGSINTLDPWVQPPSNIRYDQVCFLTAHNAFSNSEQGFAWYKQQSWGIEKQLQNGIRGLMLDIFDHNGQIKLCHGSCDGAYGFQRCFSDGIKCLLGKEVNHTPLKKTLHTIADWAHNNPKEIVTIFFENYVNNDKLDKEIRTIKKLHSLVLTTKDWCPKKNGGWPTLAWMQKNNKRIVLFNEDKSGTGVKEHHIFSYTYDHIIESQYGTLNRKKLLCERPESLVCKNKQRNLFLLNYFGTITRPRFISRKKNSYERLKKIIQSSTEKKFANGKLPNFIALDFVDQGNAMKLVNEINATIQKNNNSD